MAAMETRYPAVAAHCRRVSLYAVRLATQYGLPATTIETIRVGALLHDLGKLEVPERILEKPGRLTEREWARLRHHPEAGLGMVDRLGFDEAVAEIVLYHHERIDGSGYPDGMVGEAIPWPVRIVSVMDAYDALTSPRAYRAALSIEAARTLLSREAGSPLLPVGRVRPAVAAARDAPARRARPPGGLPSGHLPGHRRAVAATQAWRLRRAARHADAVASALTRWRCQGTGRTRDHLPNGPLAPRNLIPPRPVECSNDRRRRPHQDVRPARRPWTTCPSRWRAAKCVGLIGPNGAGKTSTLKCMVGIQAPERRDGPRRRPRHRRRPDRGEAPPGLHARRAAAVRLPHGARAPGAGRAAVRRHRRWSERSRGAARGTRTGRQGGGAARRAVAGHEAEAGDRVRPAARPGGAAVRRAADRPRSRSASGG